MAQAGGFPMARSAHPWYWQDRNGWYVNIAGQRRPLGEHPADATPPRRIKGRWNAPQIIQNRFHELMADQAKQPITPTVAAAGLTVAEVFEKFLDLCTKHRAPRTYDWYRDHIQAFCKALPNPAVMPHGELKPFHVIEWIDNHPTW